MRLPPARREADDDGSTRRTSRYSALRSRPADAFDALDLYSLKRGLDRANEALDLDRGSSDLSLLLHENLKA